MQHQGQGRHEGAAFGFLTAVDSSAHGLFGGRDMRLTDVKGWVLRDLLS